MGVVLRLRRLGWQWRLRWRRVQGLCYLFELLHFVLQARSNVGVRGAKPVELIERTVVQARWVPACHRLSGTVKDKLGNLGYSRSRR